LSKRVAGGETRSNGLQTRPIERSPTKPVLAAAHTAARFSRAVASIKSMLPAMRTRAKQDATRPSYVVVGTSAGGVAALTRIIRDLPRDFPGAVLIVMHARHEASTTFLASRLNAAGSLPVKVATHGEVIQQGTGYVAVAGRHLLVSGGRFELGDGPLEQYSKPAIDVLFRSAAQTFGSRVIGVILTGALRDGTLGLRYVNEAGGITIVQNPAHAEHGDMPKNAMRDLMVDYCLELSEIGPLLDLLVRRAGSHKQGVLETGLASSLRFMKERVRMLANLLDQSRRNPKTALFMETEIAALDKEIAEIQKLIPSSKRRRAVASHR
jgi:chemotaxis response regulator CheB